MRTDGFAVVPWQNSTFLLPQSVFQLHGPLLAGPERAVAKRPEHILESEPTDVPSRDSSENVPSKLDPNSQKDPNSHKANP
mmetsp:Transcript_19024/g.31734  ORF Transcript_19024/g.31734 Transcript_19024/m.31734 type:complete len:81 (+) Transcript_19024:364-606(+)